MSGTKPPVPSVAAASLPTPAPQTSLDQRATAASFLDNPAFSDINVLVGANKKEYKLHRIMLCINSTFFTAACKEGTFQEGQTRVIKLPEIPPAAFDVIIKWTYGGAYTLPDPFDTELILETYKATDFLGITPLRVQILAAVERWTITEHRTFQPGAGQRCILVLRKLAGKSNLSDWAGLSAIAKHIYPHRLIADSSLKDQAVSSENRNFFNNLLIERLQETLNAHLCRRCLERTDLVPKMMCDCCRASLTVAKEQQTVAGGRVSGAQ